MKEFCIPQQEGFNKRCYQVQAAKSTWSFILGNKSQDILTFQASILTIHFKIGLSSENTQLCQITTRNIDK